MRIQFNTQKQIFIGNTTKKYTNTNKSNIEENTTQKVIVPHYTFINLSQLKNMQNPNSQDALNSITRDGFTNLRDKKCLLAKIENKKNLATEQGKNLQIAMMDIDNFKSINEILGYETGDIFIKRFSEIIRKNATENNLGSYRFGGDEFVLIDIANSPDKLADICQKIKEDITQDEKLKSYKRIYEKSLLAKISFHLDKEEALDLIKKAKIQAEFLKRIFENDPTLKENEVLIKEYKRLFYELEFYTKTLIENSIKQSDNTEEKRKLQKTLDILSNGTSDEKKSIINNPKLKKYFDERFNQEMEIKQILKWQKDFNKNGFGITCAVANMRQDFFKNFSSADLINITGEVLKSGKAAKKDNIYIQNFPNEA